MTSKLYKQMVELGEKYPAATLGEIADALVVERHTLRNVMQKNGKTWEQITGWSQYERSNYRRDTGYTLQKGVGASIEICPWLTRRLRSLRHTQIEYVNGVAGKII